MIIIYEGTNTNPWLMSVVPQFWRYVGEVLKTFLMEREKAFLYGCETGLLLGEVRVKVVHILDGILQNQTNMLLFLISSTFVH